ncbi:MAG: UDP-N-acetylmuramate:L-alanyl-gamma-D-glutamyl-meso-diaminopimelate ligase [Verrucomicrobia bacterium 61-8]|nr:UDP-N-acetylmuramate:L-alanyl-gamma-D-glutamyl-meso-diaminopimelate ligase [Verrucomicrobiota bacterium]OJV25094.1 MAG: UDP-N-acetylmuramate:L-alanyl-gamma-D-glutamyl-meso-diaminopimelate ligase [Verrucomicrobia bacterium 61-8]
MQQHQHVHFLGICGTAMGAVAAAMRDRGYVITGQDDNVYPPMSTFLEGKGITITKGFRPEDIPAADVIVVGNAMTRGNAAVEAVLNRKLYYLSLPETLKQFFLRGRHNLVVTGTHGKTTTTSMLTWIFESTGQEPSYLIGGIPANLGQGSKLRDSKYFILEGDEYDTAFFDKRSKFIHYLPELVIVNNIEFDHADIYKDLDEIKTSFRRLLNIVPGNGMVLINGDDPNCLDVASKCHAPIVEVGFSPNAGNHIANPHQKGGESFFELFGTKFQIPLIGDFNIRNAAMAASAAHFYGIPVPQIQEALATFKGIKRRQEVRGITRGITVIDDFGHHPTAIRQTLAGLRERYGSARLWAIFEPRSNTTRRAVFQDDLPRAFVDADGVFIARVARLDQLPEADRLNPEKVVADIAAQGKPAFYEPTADDIVAKLAPLAQEGDVVVVFSNGGFDGIHQKLLDRL